MGQNHGSTTIIMRRTARPLPHKGAKDSPTASAGELRGSRRREPRKKRSRGSDQARVVARMRDLDTHSFVYIHSGRFSGRIGRASIRKWAGFVRDARRVWVGPLRYARDGLCGLCARSRDRRGWGASCDDHGGRKRGNAPGRVYACMRVDKARERGSSSEGESWAGQRTLFKFVEPAPQRRLQTCNVFILVCPRVVIDTAALLISPIDGHHPKLPLCRVPRDGLPVVQTIDNVLTSSDAYSTAQ